MVTKIIAHLSGKGKSKSSSEKITSLIADEIIQTKYNDIGKSKQILQGLRKMEKEDPTLKVKDKTRAGIVVEERIGKTEKQLVKISLDQVKKTIKDINKGTGNVKDKIEIFKEVDGEWVKK